MTFLATISKEIMYRTAQFSPSTQIDDFRLTLDHVFRLCNKAGFTISEIHCGNQFRPMFEDVEDNLGVTMAHAAPQAHVPEAERNNRTIKQRTRAAFHRLPHAALPTIVVCLTRR